MKIVKKMMAMITVISMVMSLWGMPAFAADPTSDDQIVEDGERIYYLASGEEAGADNFDV